MTDIERRLEEVTALISLPEVYLRVRRLMDDPTSDIYDFAEVVSVDPNLSSRVLRVVNSAYFAFPEPIESIARAVNLIGIRQLHNMVLGISAVSSLSLPNDILPLRTFWRASLFAGVLARLLGDKIGPGRGERLFIGGLLHEIGHLILYSKFPLQALAAQRIAEEQGKAIHEAEMEIMGCHYGDIGAMLMANWNLSENLQHLARYHPDPAATEKNRPEIALMHLAHACGRSETSGNPEAADNLIDAEINFLTGLSQEDLENSLDDARSISADMERVILA